MYLKFQIVYGGCCSAQTAYNSLNQVRRACMVGLDRTGHMSFLTGQDRTPKFAGQVLPDRTESGLIFLNILPNKQS